MKTALPWTLRLMLLALPIAGCVVPQTKYEEAKSAIKIEQEAHRRTQATLIDVGRKLDAVQIALGEREYHFVAENTDPPPFRAVVKLRWGVMFELGF